MSETSSFDSRQTILSIKRSLVGILYSIQRGKCEEARESLRVLSFDRLLAPGAMHSFDKARVQETASFVLACTRALDEKQAARAQLQARNALDRWNQQQ